jgi:uncharacterized protein YcbX
VIEVSALRRYPVKSCRGEDLEQAVVERQGLAGDRRWMVVDERGSALTAREYPVLVLVRPELRHGGLRLTGPHDEPLLVQEPDGARLLPVDVHGRPVEAAPAGPEADEWFTRLLRRPCRLVFLDDPDRRLPNQSRTLPTDRVSLADAYPILLASEESLAALNEAIGSGRLAEQGPVSMVRFRPNVVVRGAPAWTEDGWRRLRIGEARFRAVKGCDRCVLTLVDPDTAAVGREPLATLVRTRRWDGLSWFGTQLVPDDPGALLRVGDTVQVIEEDRTFDGPQR